MTAECRTVAIVPCRNSRTVETTVDSIGVDTPEDLERVRQLVTAAGRP